MTLGHVLFGRGTGLRVSSLALGGALFGTAWGYGAEADAARSILERYASAGGNFIDTADSYQHGESERIIGDFLASERDHFVLASKFTLGAAPSGGPLTSGNSRVAMMRSLEASLRRLRTDRIDLYWVHMPDGVTATDELMRMLDDVVRAGKVRHVGLSDFPAWRVARAATLAEVRATAPITGVQIECSLAERSGDRELLPMARAMGIGVTAWSPLGGGLLSGKYRRGEPGRATTFGHVVHREDDARKTATLDAIERVADAHGASMAQVALAWLIARGIVPIIGPRTPDQLDDNLGAAALTLADSELGVLDDASAMPLGFPHEFLAAEPQRLGVAGGTDGNLVDPYGPIA